MGEIICFVCYVGTALFIIGFGIWQVKSKKPVGFYTGEEPPRESELTDVNAWNKKHGRMWIIYGIIIILCYAAGARMLDSVLSLLPLCAGIFLPLPVMIWYHHSLVKKYKIRN